MDNSEKISQPIVPNTTSFDGDKIKLVNGETLDVQKFTYLLKQKLNDYILKKSTFLIIKSKPPARIGEIRKWKDGKLHRKEFHKWVTEPTKRIKQPNGKEFKLKSFFSKYDWKLNYIYPEFFKNFNVQKSMTKFKEHLLKHPEYKNHLGRLSILEALAIYHYSLKWGVRPLNTDLENNTLSEYTKQYEKILSTALDKLPRYTKRTPVYHGTTLRESQILDLKLKVKNGEPFKFGFFTSVELRIVDGEKYMTKNRGRIKKDERLVMFVIHAKTAKDVTNLRWRTDTHEAIIGHSAEYEVFDVSLKRNYTEIKLREI